MKFGETYVMLVHNSKRVELEKYLLWFNPLWGCFAAIFLFPRISFGAIHVLAFQAKYK